MNVTKKLGLLLAGIWFLINGLNYFVKLSFSGMGVVMALLTIIIGILLIIDR